MKTLTMKFSTEGNLGVLEASTFPHYIVMEIASLIYVTIKVLRKIRFFQITYGNLH